MKRQKDIFDLFKDNQHKLDERPSSEAWRKLESRLDKRQERHSKTIYRQIMAAASVAALIALVAVVSLTFQNKRPSFASANTHKVNVPEQFEDLVVFKDTPENVYGYVNLQRRINQSKHFQEGAPTKRLVVQTSNTPSRYSRHQTSAIAMHAPTKKEQEVATQISVESNLSKDQLALNSTKEAPLQNIEATSSSSDMAITEDNYTNEDEVLAGVTPSANSVDSKNEEAMVSPSAMPKTRKKLSKPAASAKESKRKTSSARIGSTSNKNTYTQLNQFNWLLGKWQGQVNQQQSVELWNQTDANTIVGKGYLLINGKNVFVDEMKIQKIGNDLFYFLSLTQNEAPVKYKLTSVIGNQIIFENNSIAFPKQVILQKNTATKFSTILQNQAPAQLDSKQLQYFNQRNNIQKEQVERVMEKFN